MAVAQDSQFISAELTKVRYRRGRIFAKSSFKALSAKKPSPLGGKGFSHRL
jgi:hypothetical protein